MRKKSNYHHGDLRKTLLAAAETELKRSGIEKFSLRGVARIAEVSHAAPAHHFDDVPGVLTELAVVGWQRFLATQIRHQKKASHEPIEQLMAAASGYVEFAKKYPELYELIFSSKRPRRDSEHFQQAGNAAFDHLVGLIQSLTGENPYTDSLVMNDVFATWAQLHGLASLINNDYLSALSKNKRARDTALRNMLLRYWGQSTNTH